MDLDKVLGGTPISYAQNRPLCSRTMQMKILGVQGHEQYLQPPQRSYLMDLCPLNGDMVILKGFYK